jgi:phosphomethylpyrimidine synthase
MTLREVAIKNEKNKIFDAICSYEDISLEELIKNLSKGYVVIPHNKNSNLKRPYAVGKGLKTKINANIGSSKGLPSLENELKKLKIALENGAHAIMDLSTGGDINEIRKAIRENCDVPLGTVPIYQVAVESVEKKIDIINMSVDHMFETILQQAEEGIDFMTIHAGLTLESVKRLKNSKRIMGVVSRGGSLLLNWMTYNNKENPFYEHFDRLLDIAREHDVTLSLGDGLRPGCIEDASDAAQFHELIILGELTLRAWDKDVQVMIEGPGHMPMDQIPANMILQKKLCHGAPFYVLGPLVTDIAPGYDHITSAIGGAIAAANGADFLCYVTPAEHLKLPSEDDVKEGVIAARIAAHAADIVKGIPSAREKDKKMSEARHNLNWQEQVTLSIDPIKASLYHHESGKFEGETCTMCGEYCAIKHYKNAMQNQLN